MLKRLIGAIDGPEIETRLLSIMLMGNIKTKIPKDLMNKEEPRIDSFNEQLARLRAKRINELRNEMRKDQVLKTIEDNKDDASH